MEKLGTEGLPKLLSAFEDKSATALCIYCLITSEHEFHSFRGETPVTTIGMGIRKRLNKNKRGK